MNALAIWCGFFGAWLLVFGPIYQASVELSDEQFARDTLTEAGKKVAQPEPVSTWWWLIPPVRYWLERRRQSEYRERVLAALSVDDIDRLISFSSKATGWFFVASGGVFIAAKETWHLVEHYDWPTWTFWALMVLLAAAAFANTAYRNARNQAMRARSEKTAQSTEAHGA